MTKQTVTVYTSGPSCHACRLTKRHLDKRGIEYAELPFDDADREASAYLDMRTAPVVCVTKEGVNTWWDGYRPDRIDALGGA